MTKANAIKAFLNVSPYKKDLFGQQIQCFNLLPKDFRSERHIASCTQKYKIVQIKQIDKE